MPWLRHKVPPTESAGGPCPTPTTATAAPRRANRTSTQLPATDVSSRLTGETMQIQVGQLVAAACMALMAGAAATLGAQTVDPMVGTWKVDVAQSTFTPGPAPKSATVVIEPAGKGIKNSVDRVNVDGSTTKWGLATSVQCVRCARDACAPSVALKVRFDDSALIDRGCATRAQGWRVDPHLHKTAGRSHEYAQVQARFSPNSVKAIRLPESLCGQDSQ